MKSSVHVLLMLCFLTFLVTHPASAFGQKIGGVGVKENLDLPYDASGEEGDDDDPPEIVRIYGQTYEGDGIFYCIDRSGSMQDTGELTIAKREVIRNISEFSSRIQFAIVFFDREVKKHPQNGQPAKADAGPKQAAIAWVRAMQGGARSCCQQGLVTALDYANKSQVKRKVVIYVGDGGGTCPGSEEDAYHAQTLSVVKSRNHKKVQINCIGVLMKGREKHRRFLQKLARMNNGTYAEIGH